jgi:hypothetical protein
VARGAPIRGLTVTRDHKVAAAVVFRDGADLVTTLQIAGVDEAAAADALLAAAGPERALRLSNAPVGEAPGRALARLGGRPVVRQHEMRLAF